MNDIVLYAKTEGGYEPIGTVREIKLAESDELMRTFDEEEKERAERHVDEQGFVKAFEGTMEFVFGSKEEAAWALNEVIEKWRILIEAAAEVMWERVKEMADAYESGAAAYEHLYNWWDPGETVDLAGAHRREVRERRGAGRLFERENRARMKQYSVLCTNRQKLRRTGKRYREWRGPAR